MRHVLFGSQRACRSPLFASLEEERTKNKTTLFFSRFQFHHAANVSENEIYHRRLKVANFCLRLDKKKIKGNCIITAFDDLQMTFAMRITSNAAQRQRQR